VLVVLLALAAGCRSRPAAPAVAAELVPWTDAAPPGLAEHPVPAAPRCRPAQLRVVGPGIAFRPATAGAGATGIATLRNVGRGPCRLDGRPTVRFVGAPAGPAQVQVALPVQPPTFPQVVPPASLLRALRPGAAATVAIDWRNWCVPGAARAGAALVPPRAARLSLPGGGSLDVGYSAVTPCEDPGRPATIGVRPFQPASPAEPGGWTNVRVQADVRTVAGEPVAPHGRRGELVRFAVELRNPNQRAMISFARCPAVAVLLAPAGVTEVHQLNCAAARPIPPGAAALFEMRVRVPASAPLGSNGLFWALDVTGSRPLEVVSRLIVDG
jgi:hypothetical protein